MNDDTQTTEVEAPVTTDTVETQTSEANAQQTQEAPEAAQAQEGTPEVNVTDTVEEKLFAGKYKTVEDMEAAYKELNSKFTNTTQEKAELSRILNEAFATPEQPQVVEQDAYGMEPDPVNSEIENLKRVTAVQSFIMSHEGANADAMQQVLSTDPLVKQISGHEAKLEYAYLRSQNMGQQKAIAAAEQKAVERTQAKVVEKQTAQVETTRKVDTGDEGSELYNRATGNYSKSDRDKARMEIIRKNLVNL